MYKTENELQQLPFPDQRAVIKSYLTWNFWLYLIFFVLHIASLVVLIQLGAISKILLNGWLAACFLIAGIKLRGMEDRLSKQDLTHPSFKKFVEGFMCLNWLIIAINVGGLVYLSVYLFILNNGDDDSANQTWVWPLISASHILAIIPFFYQVSKQKDLNRCLLEIQSNGDPSTDQVIFFGGDSQSQEGGGFKDLGDDKS